MAKIIVTGCAGYIGSVLVGKLLDNGHTVIGIDNLMYNQQSLVNYLTNDNFKFLFGDVIDFFYKNYNYNHHNEYVEHILDADYIIPLAAIVGAPASARCTKYAWQVNYSAVANLVNFLLSIPKTTTKIIFPTTNSGYGTKSGEVYCNEDSQLEPVSPYGEQKVDAERFLLNNYKNVITLRLATVFGVSPRMRNDLLVNYSVYRAVCDGVLTVPNSIKNNMRNYIHVLDVADLFIHCINNFDSMKGEPYNAGNDSENMSVWELSTIVQEMTGCCLSITDHYKDPDLRNYIISNDKLRKAGFEAKRTVAGEIPNIIKYYNMFKYLNYGRSENKNA
jgi:nucleoside-diphosphate-sugar epimerase